MQKFANAHAQHRSTERARLLLHWNFFSPKFLAAKLEVQPLQGSSKLQSATDNTSRLSVLKGVVLLTSEHSEILKCFGSLNFPKYKYMPPTPMDVELSFSAYQLILSKKRPCSSLSLQLSSWHVVR